MEQLASSRCPSAPLRTTCTKSQSSQMSWDLRPKWAPPMMPHPASSQDHHQRPPAPLRSSAYHAMGYTATNGKERPLQQGNVGQPSTLAGNAQCLLSRLWLEPSLSVVDKVQVTHVLTGQACTKDLLEVSLHEVRRLNSVPIQC